MARAKTLPEKFWPKVAKAGPDDCWNFSACDNGTGYKLISYGGRNIRAHRASWAIHNGPIPDDLCVLHRCDNRACVNPEHLFLGTRKENMADMMAKGRGVFRRNAKLKEHQVREIRSSSGPLREAARHYGVSRSLISKIRVCRLWKHVQ